MIGLFGVVRHQEEKNECWINKKNKKINLVNQGHYMAHHKMTLEDWIESLDARFELATSRPNVGHSAN